MFKRSGCVTGLMHAGGFILADLRWPDRSRASNIGVSVRLGLSCLLSSTVGRCGALPRHCGSTQRGSDAVAPNNSQALPHPAVRVLQSWHPGGSSRSSAEPGCRQLEGNIIVLRLQLSSEQILNKNPRMTQRALFPSQSRTGSHCLIFVSNAKVLSWLQVHNHVVFIQRDSQEVLMFFHE